MSKHIWLSTALTQAEPAIFVKSDMSENNVDLVIQAITLNEKGLPVLQEKVCPSYKRCAPNGFGQ